MTSNEPMVSAAHSSEQARQAEDFRLVVDAIPTLSWSARADGSADFFNQSWLDHTGLSAQQARDWGWTGALTGPLRPAAGFALSGLAPMGGPVFRAFLAPPMMNPAPLTKSLQFIKDSVAGRTPDVQSVGISYMYGGFWVPNTSHAMGSGDEFHVGPHIMIIGPDQNMLETLNHDGSNGTSNHLAGHHTELFLVIPIREWDDSQAVRTIGRATR